MYWKIKHISIKSKYVITNIMRKNKKEWNHGKEGGRKGGNNPYVVKPAFIYMKSTPFTKSKSENASWFSGRILCK